jgi:Domain of unknown function (DUF4157)
MSYTTSRRGGYAGSIMGDAAAGLGTPGKRTLIEQLQRRAAPGGATRSAAATRGAPLAVATTGVAGSGGALPHLARIQDAFGPAHDVSGVRAHIGGAAAAAADQIGADAYATGHDVAFRASPDLHTAAHEAAHVVQQRQGVQLYGGVGEAGDVYEAHADAVADRVVAGRSAADLLSGLGGGSAGASAGGAAVQRKDKKDPSQATATERQDQELTSSIASGAGTTAMAYLYARRIDNGVAKVHQQLGETADDEMSGGDLADAAGDMANQLCNAATPDLEKLKLVLDEGQGQMVDRAAINELNHAILRLGDVVHGLRRQDVTDQYKALETLNIAVRKSAYISDSGEYDDPGTPANPKTSDDKLLKTAILANLDAAESTARLMRMDVKTGTKDDLTTECYQVDHHLDAAKTLLGAAKKPKVYKKQVKRVTTEIATMLDEIAARGDMNKVDIVTVLRAWVMPEIQSLVGLAAKK